jgi:hypothetical protein
MPLREREDAKYDLEDYILALERVVKEGQKGYNGKEW